MTVDVVKEAVHGAIGNTDGDDTILDYIISVLQDDAFEYGVNGKGVYDVLGAIMVEGGFCPSEDAAAKVCAQLAAQLQGDRPGEHKEKDRGFRALERGPMKMAEQDEKTLYEKIDTSNIARTKLDEDWTVGHTKVRVANSEDKAGMVISLVLSFSFDGFRTDIARLKALKDPFCLHFFRVSGAPIHSSNQTQIFICIYKRIFLRFSRIGMSVPHHGPEPSRLPSCVCSVDRLRFRRTSRSSRSAGSRRNARLSPGWRSTSLRCQSRSLRTVPASCVAMALQDRR